MGILLLISDKKLLFSDILHLVIDVSLRQLRWLMLCLIGDCIGHGPLKPKIFADQRSVCACRIAPL